MSKTQSKQSPTTYLIEFTLVYIDKPLCIKGYQQSYQESIYKGNFYIHSDSSSSTRIRLKQKNSVIMERLTEKE